MKLCRRRGTYYQIGFEVGRALRETFRPPPPDADKRRLAHECESVLRDLYAPLLDELAGLVDGGEFDRDSFAAYYFARERSVHRRRCTMFAVAPERTLDGSVIVGRNYDWVRGDLRWCELREVKVNAAPACVGYSNHWIGCPDVLTERGLFIALATLPSHPLEQPGLQWNAVVEIAAATCSTCAEAVDTLSRLPHIRVMSYLVADAREAAVLEAMPGSVTRRGLDDGFVVATNCAVGPRGGAPDCRRYRGAAQLLHAAKEPLAAGAVQVILRDHEFAICNGDHGSASAENWETIWSLACKPADLCLELAPGRPCETEYRRVALRHGAVQVT